MSFGNRFLPLAIAAAVGVYGGLYVWEPTLSAYRSDQQRLARERAHAQTPPPAQPDTQPAPAAPPHTQQTQASSSPPQKATPAAQAPPAVQATGSSGGWWSWAWGRNV
eukprot:comp78390_c0_seq1/m.48318 comp78390_c0_seq1/g.48318  ORF comp78390_c0_seq1/g.48318 comp78390_c0_seq1/m.48318 type:complete len:108 (-) comp78390_c0_seq1:108-431(-)